MTRNALVSELLPEVRNYLDITWEDWNGDGKLSGIILRGMAYIQRLTPREIDFEEGTTERGLLFEYCRYARAGASDEFAVNYALDIETFRMDEKVRSHAEKEKQTNDTDV